MNTCFLVVGTILLLILTGGLVFEVWLLWHNPWVVILIPVFLVVFALGVVGQSNAKEAGISRSTLKRYARGEHER